MRCFIAIPLPGDFSGDLDKELSANGFKYKFKKNYWHITLKFISNIDNRGYLRLKKILKEISETSRVFQISCYKIDYFPSSKNHRYIAVYLVKNKSLKSLYERLQNEINWSGKKTDLRFKPHITLVKIKNEKNKFNKIIFKMMCKVKMINIYESRPRADGPYYKLLCSFNLKK